MGRYRVVSPKMSWLWYYIKEIRIKQSYSPNIAVITLLAHSWRKISPPIALPSHNSACWCDHIVGVIVFYHLSHFFVTLCKYGIRKFTLKENILFPMTESQKELVFGELVTKHTAGVWGNTFPTWFHPATSNWLWPSHWACTNTQTNGVYRHRLCFSAQYIQNKISIRGSSLHLNMAPEVAKNLRFKVEKRCLWISGCKHGLPKLLILYLKEIPNSTFETFCLRDMHHRKICLLQRGVMRLGWFHLS